MLRSRACRKSMGYISLFRVKGYIYSGLLLSIASIFASYILHGFGFNIYGDYDWYLDSGTKLLSGRADWENIFFAPLHSLSVAISSRLDLFASSYSLGSLQVIRKILFTFIAGTFLCDFSLSFCYSVGITSRISKIMLVALIIFNPYVLRYSTGVYPEFCSIIFGCLIGQRLFSTHCLTSACSSKVLRPESVSILKAGHTLSSRYKNFCVQQSPFFQISLTKESVFLFVLLVLL